jgi:hypothetical protein
MSGKVRRLREATKKNGRRERSELMMNEKEV